MLSKKKKALPNLFPHTILLVSEEIFLVANNGKLNCSPNETGLKK